MQNPIRQIIRQRESIRSYDPERPVPKEVLLRILESGRLAPSAANRQPWQFIVVESPAMLEKLRPCYPKDWFQKAPQILVVKGNKPAAWHRACDAYCSLETDLTIAMDHLILAAESEGVATCWIANFNPEMLKQALDIQPDEAVFAITPLGYPEPGYQRKTSKTRKAFTEVVRFI